MTCPDCGYQLSAFDTTCPRCTNFKAAGAATAVTQTLPLCAQPGPVQASLVPPGTCVNCGSHAIQKVSSVVRSGTWQSMSVGNTVGAAYYHDRAGGHVVPVGAHTVTRASNATNLAASLAPPRQPDSSQSWWWFMVFAAIIGVVIICFAWSATVVVPPITDTLVKVWNGSAWVPNYTPGHQDLSVLGAIGITFGVMVVVARIVTLYFNVVRPRHVQHERAWRQAMQEWEQLFYCHQCDSVFDPQTSRIASCEAWLDLLS